MAHYGLELEPDAIAGRVGFLTSTTMTTTTTTTATILAISISILLAAVIKLQAGSGASKNGVPALPEAIPYVSNTLLYMTDMKTFLSRATTQLQKYPIFSFHLGPMKVYFFKKPQNIQLLFRSTNPPTVSTDMFSLRIFRFLSDYPPAEYEKYARDRSGRLPSPLQSSGPNPPSENDGEKGEKPRTRYWAAFHSIFKDTLVRDQEVDILGRKYAEMFTRQIEARFPSTPGTVEGESEEWTAGVHIFTTLLKEDMFNAATATLFGSGLLEYEPRISSLFWDFDRIVARLVWGLPRWLNADAYRRRDRLQGALGRYLERSVKEFDWDGHQEKEVDWEPVLGSRLARVYMRWMKEDGFAVRTMAGSIVSLMFGLNGNTTQVVAWCLFEIIKDPALLRQVREEIMTALTTDESGKRAIDNKVLVNLPLLQSVFTEAIRLHFSINITREVVGPVQIEGHELEKGSILQVSTEIVHYDEDIWGAPRHPASEFWAERHIKHVETPDGRTTRQFSLLGRAYDYIPFGGGVTICPGRFFAKQEVMLTVAILVSRFDVEFEAWTNLGDGSVSDRPARNDAWFSGSAAMPPDRDMRVRMRRLW